MTSSSAAVPIASPRFGGLWHRFSLRMSGGGVGEVAGTCFERQDDVGGRMSKYEVTHAMTSPSAAVPIALGHAVEAAGVVSVASPASLGLACRAIGCGEG